MKLRRTNNRAVIFGVCSGIEKAFNIPASVTRLTFMLLSFYYGIGILLYMIAALLIISDKIHDSDYTEMIVENFNNTLIQTNKIVEAVYYNFQNMLLGKEKVIAKNIGLLIVWFAITILFLSLGLLKFLNFGIVLAIIFLLAGIALYKNNQ